MEIERGLVARSSKSDLLVRRNIFTWGEQIEREPREKV
jgi:hypothetical protein